MEEVEAALFVLEAAEQMQIVELMRLLKSELLELKLLRLLVDQTWM